MKTTPSLTSGQAHWTAALVAVAGISCLTLVQAQEPRSRPDLSGTWGLDMYLSDHPEEVARAIRIDTGQPSEEDLGNAGIDRGRPDEVAPGGRGRGGIGGPGRVQPAPAAQAQMNPDDRKKLIELTDAVRFASTTLTISQSDGDVTITSTRAGSQTLHTNGNVEKQQLSAGVVDRVASWEGFTLVVGYEVGRAGRLTYRYLLVPATKQLLIRVNFERPNGPSGPFDIKLVYNRTAQP